MDKPWKLDVVSVRLNRDAPLYSDHPVRSAQDALDIIGRELCELDREVVAVMSLQSNGKPINVSFASMGAINYAVIHPRELFKSVFLSNAESMILIHNHPTGDLIPSQADVQITDRLNRICQLMGVPLVDHIIVGGDNTRYFSFREKDMIVNESLHYETNYQRLDVGCVAESGQTTLQQGAQELLEEAQAQTASLTR